MKCLLTLPVPTNLVVPALESALKRLKDMKVLQNEWLLQVVQTNDLSSSVSEYGAVLYPVRHENGNVVPQKHHRIVLGALPSTSKVKTFSVEVGFGRGYSTSPLSGVDDCPKGGFFTSDRKYAKDFSTIVTTLVEILSSPALPASSAASTLAA